MSRRPPTLTALTINKFRREGELRDGLVRGFGIRVKNGVKNFDFIYTSPLTIRKRVRYSIGPIAEKVKDGEAGPTINVLFVVDDPALAAKPIVGVFRATDLEGFSAAAAEALKAKAVPDGDVIRLSPGAP